MNPVQKLTKKLKDKASVKAKALYDSASPKVQEKIDEIISQKSDDVIKNVTNVVTVGAIIFFIVKSMNSPKASSIEPPSREIYNFFYEVHNTYNYYGKDDQK